MPNRKAWFLLALLPLAACATPGTTPAATGAQPAPAAGSSDARFAMAAAANDSFEIRSAQLAVGKARRPAVRAYAQRLLDAHTAASRKLAGLAAAKGIALPAGPDAAGERALAELGGNAGGFDAAFVAGQVAAHQSAIAATQAEIDGGSDPELVAYARAALPDLKSHLAMAQRLHGGR